MTSNRRHSGDSQKRSHRKWLILLGVSIVSTGILGAILVPPMVFRHKCRDGIESLLKTRVEIGSAEVSFSMDHGVINELVIYNPEGYVDKPFMVIPKITFQKGSTDPEGGMIQITSIELHDPVMYLEISGETSNLKDVMAQMMVPTGNPPPPVKIALLKITNGTIASYPDKTGHQNVSPFPIEEVKNLEGRPGKIANRIAMELQKSMDERMKETVKALKKDLIKGFSDLFDF